MALKIMCIFFLWIMTEFFILWCSGLPHSLDNINDFASSNHSEAALMRLLRLFGLDSTISQQRKLTLPPQYMLDLYKSYSDNSVTEQNVRYRRANTVRSFSDKGESSDEGHYYYELKDSVPRHEEIVDAEFHFFTNKNALRLPQNSHIIQVQLYEEQENATSKLLQARMVSAHSSGWEVFRVKSSVKKWLSHPESNKGLTIKVLDSVGHEWSNRRVHRLQNSRKPILIIFSKDPKITKVATPRSSQDSNSLQSIPANESRTKRRNNLEKGSTRNTRSASVPENGLCSRHELRVDFDKLGWSTWIISPKWYDAYVCSGACAFPLGQNLRPTNHATVQSIVHELGLTDGVRAPCCVPTELHPVSLLYFDERSNVVLKQYDDMIAAGCGCQ